MSIPPACGREAETADPQYSLATQSVNLGFNERSCLKKLKMEGNGKPLMSTYRRPSVQPLTEKNKKVKRL